MGTDPLGRVRALCLALPEVSERLSHGTPTWFVRARRSFVIFWDDHHGDGRLALWCAAPPGAQDTLVADDPDRYFRPPYVGHRGWVGVRIDQSPDWDEVAEVVHEAFAAVAPASLVERL